MIDSLFLALQNLLTVTHMLYLLGGVLLGICIGILPGLGGIVGFSILLPFVYGLDVTDGLALLIGLVAVIPTSDTFTSVLMGIPGSSSSQATVLDGYPLSKQGQAARALSAAFLSSLIGGLLGAMLLTVVIVFAQTFILSLGSAELLMLGLLGLSMVGVLSSDSLTKGILACGVGLLLGSIGAAPATGEWRMTLGSYYLFDGIKLVIVGLGIFAVPEIIDLLVQNRKISDRSVLGKGWLQGIKDVIKHKWVVFRCAPLGTLIGAIPGLGGNVVDWLAYGHVVQTSKDKSQFGKGDIRGVIAPESANNAKEGGGLIPTLLFGIPGSGSMAVFLGGLTVLGVETGPSMVTNQLDVSYAIIWSLALANVLGTIVCILLSGSIAKLTTVPYGFMAPFMIMMVSFAAFQTSRSLEDLMLLMVIGVVGTLFKFFNWSRPALLVGFVLGGTVETYLYQAVQFYSWSMFARTGVIVILSFAVVSIFMATFWNKKSKKDKSVVKAGETPLPSDNNNTNINKTSPYFYSVWTGETFFALGLLLFSIYALIDGLALSFLGKVFPTSVSAVMIIAGIVLLVQLFSLRWQEKVLSRPILQKGKLSSEWIAIWKNFLWIVLLCAGTWLVGFIAALIVTFIAIIRIKTQASWVKTLTITFLAISFLLFIQNIMVLHLPTGLIYDSLFLNN